MGSGGDCLVTRAYGLQEGPGEHWVDFTETAFMFPAGISFGYKWTVKVPLEKDLTRQTSWLKAIGNCAQGRWSFVRFRQLNGNTLKLLVPDLKKNVN